jgi:RNA polymerase sigma factor (sigma-70 family)
VSRWILERRADAQSDQRLADRARRGDEAAFAAIVARYHAPLLGMARRLRSDGRAEDIVQQTFLNALIALRSGAEVRHLRGWLHQILRHAASRVPSPSDVALDPERESGGAMVDDDVERRLAVRQVLSAMVALPDRQREAMVATALEGRSRSAVAEAMGLSDGAVRQLVHRARQTLREAAYALTPWPLQRWLTRPGSGPSGGAGSDAAVALSAPVPAAAAKLAAVVASGALAAGVLGPGGHGRTRAHPSGSGATAARRVHSGRGGTVLAAGEHARLTDDRFAISRLASHPGDDGTGRGSQHESEHGHDRGGDHGASGGGGPGPSADSGSGSGSGSGSDGRVSGSGSGHGGGGSGPDGGGTSGSGPGGGSGTTSGGGSDGGSGPDTVTTTASSGGGPGPETVTTTASSGGGPGPSPTTSVSSDEGSGATTSGSGDGSSNTTTSSGGGSTSGH